MTLALRHCFMEVAAQGEDDYADIWQRFVAYLDQIHPLIAGKNVRRWLRSGQ